MRAIRIFISSPGDVAEEREKARQIIDQLRKRYAGQLELVAVLWEDLPLSLDLSFQEGIDRILSETRGIDVAVFIIWSRLGSPVGSRVAKADGSAYRSGTERELDLMLAARQASGGHRPALLAYVRNDAEGFQARMSGEPLDDIPRMIEQKHLADQFVREHFQDAATGTNVRAYHSYAKPITYAVRLRVHLQALLDEMVQEQPAGSRWDGPPFRGLEAFDVEHASIFFGREAEVADVLLALQAGAAAGRSSVVVAGASGAGKSSLVRAGLIPALVEQNLDDGTAQWRYLVVRPGARPADLLLGLARAMGGKTALPELGRRLNRFEDLAAALADSPELAFRLTIGPALQAMDDSGGGGGNGKPARLLVVVDQLEEAFTHAGAHADIVDQYFRALRVLAETDRVRVVATVRSDFYAEVQQHDDLVALKAGAGLYDLLPPRPAALHQMITRPVALAGLRFGTEPGTGRSLDRRRSWTTRRPSRTRCRCCSTRSANCSRGGRPTAS